METDKRLLLPTLLVWSLGGQRRLAGQWHADGFLVQGTRPSMIYAGSPKVCILMFGGGAQKWTGQVDWTLEIKGGNGMLAVWRAAVGWAVSLSLSVGDLPIHFLPPCHTSNVPQWHPGRGLDAPLKKLQNEAERPRGSLFRPLLTSDSPAAAC